MALLDPRKPVDDTQRIAQEFDRIKRRLDQLESPTGSQAYRSVEKLTALVTNIQAQLDTYNAARYTNAQIDARIAAPPGAVTVAGAFRANTGVSSTGVYSNLLSSAYRVQYVDSTGAMGYVPSSRRVKQDIVTAHLNAADISKLRLVTFRYREAVEQLGDDAATEIGLIAEEVAEIPGLRWLVDWDEDGLPCGIHYERLALALLVRVDDHETRIATLERALRNITTI